MEGQWVGTFSGSNQGHITLNLEIVNNQITGHVVIVDFNTTIPSSVAKIIINTSDNINYRGQLFSFLPISKTTFLPSPWETARESFDATVRIPSSGGITLHSDDQMHANGTWNTDIGTNGQFSLTKSLANEPSQYPTTILSWQEFKEFISSLDPVANYLFRGQTGSQRLRTSYHRTGRSDITRYTSHIPDLQKHIYAQTNYLFNLNNALEYAALLSLAQHHGYPTPLLDWSKSPYVAAYFAYKGLRSNVALSENVRIYIFDAMNWRANTITVQHIDSPVLSITPLEVLPILNNRAIPQQSVTTFSNVDDVETFIQTTEQRKNASYLKIIELPLSEKINVLRDLNQMNVNSGSLFPGLDGVCQMLKEMHF